MRFTLSYESRIGNRPKNQDRFASRSTEAAVLLVVADGMGGHAHGELAAQTAVDCIVSTFLRIATPSLPDPDLFVSRVLQDAHQAIMQAALKRNLQESPRTTCVVCVIQDGTAYCAHAGDSRFYAIRQGEVLARTLDHNRVQMLLAEGLISEEEARRHPARNRVFNCLGGSSPPQGEPPLRHRLLPDDLILLCTDGIWGPLGDNAIARQLRPHPFAENLRRLADTAEINAAPHGDNMTGLALRWETAPEPD